MKKIVEKAAVLIEALPYIQRFRNAIVVVKYGGSTMETHDPDAILRDVVFMECVGMRPVVVHGGGGAINRRLKEAGVTPHFSGGLRVTDAQTMKVVKEVLLEVNRDIVRRIRQLGGQARSVTWKDGVFRARKRVIEEMRDGKKVAVDIGYVGDVADVKAHTVRALCNRDIIPVITPVGIDKKGACYNINADTVAGAIAVALKARKLVLLTDVRGILREQDNEDSLIETLHYEDVRELTESGVITAGMLPKIDATIKACRSGVRKTHIIDGRLPHSLLLEIFTDRGIGTEIVGKKPARKRGTKA
jgi:acetylglutamate kinase